MKGSLQLSWMTVRIEIGHNEIGDADSHEMTLPEDVAAAFVALGFPKPMAIPVMSLPYQVAQKLHAVSGEDGDRAHDMIDFQLIERNSSLDLAEVKSVCERLFDYRREQSWPPRLVKGESWARVYDEARATLRNADSVLATVDEAVAWTNKLIERIVAS